jgi:DNA-binding transcriptional regulator of glucitol operon
MFANFITPAACRSYRPAMPHLTHHKLDAALPIVTRGARYRRGVSAQVHRRRRRRPALIILVIVTACGCLALGWWQWTRFQEPSGTFQNLGYALQWPLFAWFCVYAYRKFVRYEEVPPEPRNSGSVSEIPAGVLPERPTPEQPPSDDDPALREYNAYLAELAKKDTEKQNRTTA